MQPSSLDNNENTDAVRLMHKPNRSEKPSHRTVEQVIVVKEKAVLLHQNGSTIEEICDEIPTISKWTLYKWCGRDKAIILNASKAFQMMRKLREEESSTCIVFIRVLVVFWLLM